MLVMSKELEPWLSEAERTRARLIIIEHNMLKPEQSVNWLDRPLECHILALSIYT